MDADQLADLARRAANRTGYRQILVLGSQAVHGSLPGVELPDITTISVEADLAVVNDLSGGTPHEIEAAFGMGSPYHQRFGVYADGISLTEVALPAGWEGRLRDQQIADDDNPDNPVTLLFPEIHDLCASKLTVAVTGGPPRRSHHRPRPPLTSGEPPNANARAIPAGRAIPVLACQHLCMHNACMTSITIRDVPDEVRDELAARARLSGRSLQEYLRSELTELAGRPDPAVLMAQVRERTRRTGSRLSASQILAHRDHDRR